MTARQGFIGQSVERREDARFLTGNGQYTDDITLPGQTLRLLPAPPVRPRAASRASTPAPPPRRPGVLGIFTGEHFKAVGGLPCGWLINSMDGPPMKEPKHPVLADGKVRYVGDRVALVVAETLEQAKAAAELIEVDYDELTAGGRRADRAADRGRRCTTRRPTTVSTPGASATRTAPPPRWPGAAHVTTLTFRNNRLIPNAIEPRAANAQLQRQRRQLHAVRHQPEPARRAAADVRLRAGHPRAQDARGGARRGRRLRLQDLPVRRRDGPGLGQQADRPADQVDRRPQRGLPVRRPRPRPCHDGRDWPGQGRQVPGPAGATPRPTWAPTCRPSPSACRPSCTPPCWPASTPRRRSTRR